MHFHHSVKRLPCPFVAGILIQHRVCRCRIFLFHLPPPRILTRSSPFSLSSLTYLTYTVAWSCATPFFMLQFVHQSATVIFFQKPRSVCFNPVSKGCPTACKIALNFCFIYLFFALQYCPLWISSPSGLSVSLYIFFIFFCLSLHFYPNCTLLTWKLSVWHSPILTNLLSVKPLPQDSSLYLVLFPRRMLVKQSREASTETLVENLGAHYLCYPASQKTSLYLGPFTWRMTVKTAEARKLSLVDFEQCKCQPNICTCPPHFLLEPACSVTAIWQNFLFLTFPFATSVNSLHLFSVLSSKVKHDGLCPFYNYWFYN